MLKVPIRFNKLWDAFKNVAIVFSFCFNLIALCVIVVFLALLLKQGPRVQQEIMSPKAQVIQQSLHDLENATINLTVPISETMPINFNLPVHTRTIATTTRPVPLRTGASFVLPGGGGTIRGTVNLVLPAGLQLPVELHILVPVSQTVPVQMEVPVSIALKDTELGEIIRRLREELLEPLLKVFTQ